MVIRLLAGGEIAIAKNKTTSPCHLPTHTAYRHVSYPMDPIELHHRERPITMPAGRRIVGAKILETCSVDHTLHGDVFLLPTSPVKIHAVPRGKRLGSLHTVIGIKQAVINLASIRAGSSQGLGDEHDEKCECENQVISNTGFESPCSTKGESFRFSPLETPSVLCPPQEAGFTLKQSYPYTLLAVFQHPI